MKNILNNPSLFQNKLQGEPFSFGHEIHPNTQLNIKFRPLETTVQENYTNEYVFELLPARELTPEKQRTFMACGQGKFECNTILQIRQTLNFRRNVNSLPIFSTSFQALQDISFSITQLRIPNAYKSLEIDEKQCINDFSANEELIDTNYLAEHVSTAQQINKIIIFARNNSLHGYENRKATQVHRRNYRDNGHKHKHKHDKCKRNNKLNFLKVIRTIVPVLLGIEKESRDSSRPEEPKGYNECNNYIQTVLRKLGKLGFLIKKVQVEFDFITNYETYGYQNKHQQNYLTNSEGKDKKPQKSSRKDSCFISGLFDTKKISRPQVQRYIELEILGKEHRDIYSSNGESSVVKRQHPTTECDVFNPADGIYENIYRCVGLWMKDSDRKHYSLREMGIQGEIPSDQCKRDFGYTKSNKAVNGIWKSSKNLLQQQYKNLIVVI
ncbi:hypothetical protein BB560_003781 [Smittium megazygosporum]|uniref:Uncharacterized protein n=1 Tax=Smittium megazygosporum TaxID=133381 RepID=A0A2T9ZB03_9FUNG|nr:hypothetical protein BB560_003781 [Smittium megazygosporum]